MYKCVVVGTDGSSTADKAVQVAAELARGWGSALHIVTAYQAGGGSGMGSSAALVDTGASAAIHQEAAEHIGQKAVESHGEGLQTTVHAVSDNPPDAILNTAQSVDADLVVVGSKGMKGARRILGSVPNSVAHGANCAVLVVKTD
jgi:nucleotide-binding universal stress UspA family protein